ncbi:hypothetical protein JZ751_013966, partial [Albula glossodonta]
MSLLSAGAEEQLELPPCGQFRYMTKPQLQQLAECKDLTVPDGITKKELPDQLREALHLEELWAEQDAEFECQTQLEKEQPGHCYELEKFQLEHQFELEKLRLANERGPWERAKVHQVLPPQDVVEPLAGLSETFISTLKEVQENPQLSREALVGAQRADPGLKEAFVLAEAQAVEAVAIGGYHLQDGRYKGHSPMAPVCVVAPPDPDGEGEGPRASFPEP